MTACLYLVRHYPRFQLMRLCAKPAELVYPLLVLQRHISLQSGGKKSLVLHMNHPLAHETSNRCYLLQICLPCY
jgi:hypothetical protein